MTHKKNAKTENLLEEIKNHLVSIYSLDPDQVNEMLQLSSKILVESLEQAKMALADNDKVNLSALAHKIKGVLLGTGLKQEADLALTIEHSAKEELEAPYQQLLDELQESVLPLLQLFAE